VQLRPSTLPILTFKITTPTKQLILS